jgi:hypothetical protein
MRQGLPGRNNPVFPIRFISSAHLLFSLPGFGSVYNCTYYAALSGQRKAHLTTFRNKIG